MREHLLHESIAQWPHNPIFRNYLYNAYLLMVDQESAEAEMHNTSKLFGRLIESLPYEFLRDLQRKLLEFVMTRRVIDVLKIVATAQSNPAEMDKLTKLLVSN